MTLTEVVRELVLDIVAGYLRSTGADTDSASEILAKAEENIPTVVSYGNRVLYFDAAYLRICAMDIETSFFYRTASGPGKVVHAATEVYRDLFSLGCSTSRNAS